MKKNNLNRSFEGATNNATSNSSHINNSKSFKNNKSKFDTQPPSCKGIASKSFSFERHSFHKNISSKFPSSGRFGNSRFESYYRSKDIPKIPVKITDSVNEKAEYTLVEDWDEECTTPEIKETVTNVSTKHTHSSFIKGYQDLIQLPVEKPNQTTYHCTDNSQINQCEKKDISESIVKVSEVKNEKFIKSHNTSKADYYFGTQKNQTYISKKLESYSHDLKEGNRYSNNMPDPTYNHFPLSLKINGTKDAHLQTMGSKCDQAEIFAYDTCSELSSDFEGEICSQSDNNEYNETLKHSEYFDPSPGSFKHYSDEPSLETTNCFGSFSSETFSLPASSFGSQESLEKILNFLKSCSIKINDFITNRQDLAFNVVITVSIPEVSYTNPRHSTPKSYPQYYHDYLGHTCNMKEPAFFHNPFLYSTLPSVPYFVAPYWHWNYWSYWHPSAVLSSPNESLPIGYHTSNKESHHLPGVTLSKMSSSVALRPDTDIGDFQDLDRSEKRNMEVKNCTQSTSVQLTEESCDLTEGNKSDIRNAELKTLAESKSVHLTKEDHELTLKEQSMPDSSEQIENKHQPNDVHFSDKDALDALPITETAAFDSSTIFHTRIIDADSVKENRENMTENMTIDCESMPPQPDSATEERKVLFENGSLQLNVCSPEQNNTETLLKVQIDPLSLAIRQQENTDAKKDLQPKIIHKNHFKSKYRFSPPHLSILRRPLHIPSFFPKVANCLMSKIRGSDSLNWRKDCKPLDIPLPFHTSLPKKVDYKKDVVETAPIDGKPEIVKLNTDNEGTYSLNTPPRWQYLESGPSKWYSPVEQNTWANEFVSRSKAYKNKFIDSHCHIDLLYQRLNISNTPFKNFREENADYFPANYEGCIAIFCNPRTFSAENSQENIVNLLSTEDDVWFSFGCHPKSALEFTESHEIGLKKILSHPKVVSLGEIGLDYSGMFCQHAEVQKNVFRRQLSIALELNLPLVIHCRDADDDCLEILQEVVPRDHRIHAHCFTRNMSVAQRWLSAFPNLFIGLTPVVTYKTAVGAIETASLIPLNRLLLETDTPYFIPRMKQRTDIKFSYPGFALFTAERVAEIKGLPVDVILKACRENTRKMYGI
ncbi:hypothetical protein Btru_062064 [Bulinus truncatus]|nr:hypothetical protein Btru_062064 [Bulinus truncatus]